MDRVSALRSWVRTGRSTVRPVRPRSHCLGLVGSSQVETGQQNRRCTGEELLLSEQKVPERWKRSRGNECEVEWKGLHAYPLMHG